MADRPPVRRPDPGQKPSEPATPGAGSAVASLDTVTYADLTELEGNPEAAEGEDLDYKREMSASTDEQKAELAKHVAAFANHIGGLLIVGMADAKGTPSKVMDGDVSEPLPGWAAVLAEVRAAYLGAVRRAGGDLPGHAGALAVRGCRDGANPRFLHE
ncbi:ATP-binding protein [Streptomyces sp. NPDC049597]|uniref:AlbA family DNA-binding domain-containing protein n=1 Tax=Streptomyces sp. NPDC049597 TaxID=3155276 RepID=UPI0034493D62